MLGANVLFELRRAKADAKVASFVAAQPRPDQLALSRRRAGALAPAKRRATLAVDHEVHWDAGCTVIGLATRGIMMIESCKVIAPTENQIPVAWNG